MSCFALVASWYPFASDYSRYLPRSSSTSSVTLWAMAGVVVPMLLLGLFGLLLPTIDANLAAGQGVLAVISRHAPAWVAVPFFAFVGLGEVWANYFDVYTAGLVTLAMGIRLRRWQTALACGVLWTAFASYAVLVSDFQLPVALTIAGSDSGGGAGIQADLKTFAAMGVHGTSALTAITAQNTLGVTDIMELPPALVAAQIAAVMLDIGAQGAKTGMLSSAEIIEVVATSIAHFNIRNLVVDPVMVAKGGARLLRDDAAGALRRRLIPLAAVVTPNLPEAEVLLGRPVGPLAERLHGAPRLPAPAAPPPVPDGS